TDLELAEAVDLKAIVRDVVAGQRVACAAKGIRLDERLDDVVIHADAGKVRTVVDNLVTNAVKFTPRNGEIRVALGANGDYAFLDVIDTGPGVAPGESERIFEPFVQGAAECHSSVKGTGLGLAIAKEFAEAHGGYVTVLDAERGAHFRAAFPLGGPRLPAMRATM